MIMAWPKDGPYKHLSYVAATYTDARFMSSVGSDDTESIFAGAVHDNKLPYIPEANISFGFGLIL